MNKRYKQLWKYFSAKAILRFLKKYITKNLLTKHTENLSPPPRYYIYTHIRFLKTAVKMHTPLFAGSSVDQSGQGLPPHTEHGEWQEDRTGLEGVGGGPSGRKWRPPHSVLLYARLSWPNLWYGVYTSPQFYPNYSVFTVLTVNLSPTSNKYFRWHTVQSNYEIWTSKNI